MSDCNDVTMYLDCIDYADMSRCSDISDYSGYADCRVSFRRRFRRIIGAGVTTNKIHRTPTISTIGTKHLVGTIVKIRIPCADCNDCNDCNGWRAWRL